MTVTMTIDGVELQVPKGTLVIRAAEQLGITIPRFCDHPLLDPLGACRQCIVEVEGQRKPMTSCTTTCTDGMVVKTHLTSDVARDAQEGVLEFLLINHPLDCPQCDKGGECPLQDQTLAHGPEGSRFIDAKRRYVKPVPISALVALDRERCVLCARCTRFSSEISGDPFIELFERGALEQVAIYEDEPYTSYFSGNVTQICPVGALTAADYRFKARPFDLLSFPTVCNQCSAGCNLRTDVRSGEITRQLARENMAVNEMWNCDRGRHAYQYVHSGERLHSPLIRSYVGGLAPVSWTDALRRAAAGFKEAGPAVGVITGGRLTDEDAYALSRFTRGVLRSDNVDFRMRPRTDEERDVLAAVAGTLGPTYDDVEHAPVVVVAGLDPQEEVPILFLRLRKAWRRHRQRIIVVGPTLGHLDEIAWRWLPTPAGGEARLLADLSDARRGGATNLPDEVVEAVGAESLIVLAGERLSASPGALRAAATLGSAGRFAWVPRRNNARGAVDAGLLPGLLPGGRRLDDAGPVGQTWGELPDTAGLDTRQMLEAAADGQLKVLYLVGADVARDFEDPRLAVAALERADLVIAQDLLHNDTTRYADVVLPALAPQERVGSYTTWEGRRQPFTAALPAPGVAQHDWDIFRQLAWAMGVDLGWESADDVRREAAPLFEVQAGDRLAALNEVHPIAPPPPPKPGGMGGSGPLSAPGGMGGSGPLSATGGMGGSGPPSATGGMGGSGPPSGQDGEFDVVVIDQLLAGSMLIDAKALQETARPATVWLHPDDAAAMSVTSGRHVALFGGGGRVELPALVTDRVVSGCVVLPGTSSGVAAGALVDAGAPLRVRLEAAEGSSDVTYPSRRHDPTAAVVHLAARDDRPSSSEDR